MTYPVEAHRANPDIATYVPLGDGEILINIPDLKEISPEVAVRIETQADPETIGDLRNWQQGVELAKPGLIRRLMSAIGTAARFMQHLATRKPAANPWDEVAALEKELQSKAADRENEQEPKPPLAPSQTFGPRDI